jgi:transcriptional regulator with PAS, ATPase and Fis domain
VEPYFGQGQAMRKVAEAATLAAGNDSVVLLQGKTGTGKGVLARWIHERSSRALEPFVEINCAGLRGELLSSELFGHVKGSFTSASQDRQGLIEVADHGTLFLDEICDMDLAVQALFLKTIEEKTYRRVGDSKERTSGFRLMCASNRQLAEETQKNRFRSDLYYRICVFPIEMPGLVDRPEDIPGLAVQLLSKMRADPPALTPEALSIIQKYEWPGNIREMKNVLERAVILSQGNTITPDHLPGLIDKKSAATIPATDNLEEMENAHIHKILDRCEGNHIQASQLLGISRASLYRKISKANHTK